MLHRKTVVFYNFFFNDAATTEFYTLSLHDALPILLTGPPEHLSGDAWVMTEGGVAGVYVTNPERRAELLPELRRIFSDIEGIEKIYGTDEFAEIEIGRAHV